MIEFACPGCQKRYRLGDEMAGKKVKTSCQACGQVIVLAVPAAVPAAIPVAEIVEPAGPPALPSLSATTASFSAASSSAASPRATIPRTASPNAALPDATMPPKPRASSSNLVGTTSELRYEISQRPDYSIVSIQLAPGKKIMAEPSAMVSMTPNVLLEAGFKGGLGKTLGRMLGGESLIINTFTAQHEPGEIMFAGGSAGDISYQRLEGQTLYLQRGAYMLNTEGVEVTGKWQGAKGFFGGEGLVLLKASGVGDLFFNSYGAILEIDVKDGFIVDSGYIVAFESTLDYHVTVLPGLRSGGKIKSFFFGGEGLVCQFSGVGRVWIQTRQVQSFLSWTHAFRPAKKN